MIKITIEDMDKVIKRVPNATYKQAKEALEYAEGNVIDAIIYLESKVGASRGGASKTEIFGKDTDEIKEQIMDLIKRSNVIRIIIEKDDEILLNLPVAAGVIGIVIGPTLTLIGLSAAVLSKCKIKITNEDNNTIIDLGQFSEEKLSVIKDVVTSKAKDVKNVVDAKYKVKESKTNYKNSNVDGIVINMDKK